MGQLALFKIFPDINQAMELISLLEKNEITFSLIDNSHDVDLTFTGNNNQSNIQLLLNKDDFGLVNSLMEEIADSQLNLDDEDHYLYDFTNSELFEILEKKDEWSVYDYQLAKKILEKRGENVGEEKVLELKKKREIELSKPERGPKNQIFAGYLFALFGGLIGFLIGWFLWKSKKTLPDGNKIYTYEMEQRKHGRRITFISFVALIIWSTYFIVYR